MAAPDDFGRMASLYALAAGAAPKALLALVEEATDIEDAYMREQSLIVLFSRWASLDPAGSVRGLDVLSAQDQVLMAEHVYFTWARSTPEAAIAEVALERTVQRQERAVRGILRAVRGTSGDYQAAIEAALGGREDLARLLLLEDIGRHAATDPVLALARANTLQNPAAREQALRWVMSAWVRSDPASAYAEAQQLEPVRFRDEVLSFLLTRWAQRDPETVLSTVEDLPPDRYPRNVLGNIAASFLRSDPDRALALVERLATSDPGAYHDLFRAWSTVDARAAAQRLLSFKGSMFGHSGLLDRIAGDYARQYPDEVLVWATGIDNPQLRGKAIRGALEVLADADPAAALALLPQLVDDPVWEEVAPSLMGEIAASKPELALEALSQLEDADVRRDAQSRIVSRWLERDPRAAFAWVQSLSGDDYTRTMETAAEVMSRVHTDLAAELLPSVRGPARQRWMQGIARGYARIDHARALAWLEQYRGDPSYDGVLGVLVPAMAKNEPAAAMEQARRLRDPELQARTMSIVMSYWAERDPSAAAMQLSAVPAGPHRERVVAVLARALAHESLDRAVSWARSLPGQHDRDLALEPIMGSAELTSTQAVALLRAIEDPESQRKGAYRFMLQAARRDRDEARRFLDQIRGDLDAEALRMLEIEYEQLPVDRRYR